MQYATTARKAGRVGSLPASSFHPKERVESQRGDIAGCMITSKVSLQVSTGIDEAMDKVMDKVTDKAMDKAMDKAIMTENSVLMMVWEALTRVTMDRLKLRVETMTTVIQGGIVLGCAGPAIRQGIE